MGEIVDLEHYRKLRKRREAEAGKVSGGELPDVQKAADSSTSPAVNRAGPGQTGPESATQTGGDDLKTD